MLAYKHTGRVKGEGGRRKGEGENQVDDRTIGIKEKRGRVENKKSKRGLDRETREGEM